MRTIISGRATVAKLTHIYFYLDQTGSTYDDISTIKESFTSNTRTLQQVTAGSRVLREHQDPKSQVRNDRTIPLTIRTYIDASFAVHSDYKSHTGICISLGVGIYYSKSTAQKINNTSSCQAEMMALAKGLLLSVFSAFFLAGEGYSIPQIIVKQDN